MTNRELNAEIAEKILNHEVCRNKKGGWSIGPADYYDDHGELILSNPLPDYCGDIKDAWEVVEKMFFLGSGFDLHAEYCGDVGMNGFSCKFADFNKKGWCEEVYGETAPKTICLAALKAIERLKND